MQNRRTQEERELAQDIAERYGELLAIGDLSNLLGASKDTAYRWAALQNLPYYIINNRRKWQARDVAHAIDTQRVGIRH